MTKVMKQNLKALFGILRSTYSNFYKRDKLIASVGVGGNV